MAVAGFERADAEGTASRNDVPWHGQAGRIDAGRPYVSAVAAAKPTAPKSVAPKRSKADSLRLVGTLKRALVIGAIGGFIGLSGLVGTRLAATAGTASAASSSTSGSSASSSSSSASSGGYFGQSGGSSLGNDGSSSSSSGAVAGTSVS